MPRFQPGATVLLEIYNLTGVGEGRLGHLALDRLRDIKRKMRTFFVYLPVEHMNTLLSPLQSDFAPSSLFP